MGLLVGAHADNKPTTTFFQDRKKWINNYRRDEGGRLQGRRCWSFISSTTFMDGLTSPGTDIYAPLRINSNNFGDPPIYHLAAPSGQHFNMPNTWVHDHIPSKLLFHILICLSWMQFTATKTVKMLTPVENQHVSTVVVCMFECHH